jgi:hypothetical protein
MAVERVSSGNEAAAHERGPGSPDDYALTDDDVLAFLFDLRVDRQRCHNLNSGVRLVREAAETGLVEPDDVEPFVAQMIELRDGGLAGWTPATHDSRGDDLLHAAEFHLTPQGRSRLRAVGAGS